MNVRTGGVKTLQTTILPIVCLIGSLLIIKQVGSFGLAALILETAEKQNSTALADRGISIFPECSFFYNQRGNIFLNLEQPGQAVSDFEKDVELSPQDYWAWIQLGYARQESNEPAKAIEAYQQAIRLIPFYGLPHWYLGQVYFQTGNQEEAWNELRTAYHLNFDLLPAAIRFAWGQTRGKPGLIEEKLELKTRTDKMILGLFLLEQGDTTEAGSYLCNSSELPETDRQRLVSRLFNQREFRLAYLVETGECLSGDDVSKLSTGIRNGGFESDIQSNNRSFDWQTVTDQKNIQIARDRDRHAEGSFSLEVNFNGNVDNGLKIIRQLLLVESNSRYQLTYQTQTKGLLTDCPPQITVSDAARDGQILGAGEGFSSGGEASWKTTRLEFETPDETQAVWITLQRKKSNYGQCPVLGSIWIDDLSLYKVKTKEEK